MATYSGSGKWIKIESGDLKFGNNNTTYSRTYASTISCYNGSSYENYHGLTTQYASVVDLTSVQSLTIGNKKCFTGNTRMYTTFYYPYSNFPIWDDSWMRPESIIRKSKWYEWSNGIMIGEFLDAPSDWWDNVDWNDEDLIVPDDDYSDDLGETGDRYTELNGAQHRLVKYSFTDSSPYQQTTRSYAEVTGGKIEFGYRNANNSATRIKRSSIESTSYTSSGTTYNGIKINADKLKISQDYYVPLKLRFKVDSSDTQATGYMRFISYVYASHSSGVDWKIEEWPFLCGFCVVRRP